MSKHYKRILEELTERNPEALLADGFDQALIGMTLLTLKLSSF